MIIKLQFTLSPDNKNLIDPLVFPMNITMEVKPSTEPLVILTLDKKRPELLWMKLNCSL